MELWGIYFIFVFHLFIFVLIFVFYLFYRHLFHPPQRASQTVAFYPPHMLKKHLPLKINSHPRPHPNSALLPRSDPSAQAGRNSKSCWSLKSGWTRSGNRLHDQSSLIPPLHHQDNPEPFVHHQPHHPIDPCLRLSCLF